MLILKRRCIRRRYKIIIIILCIIYCIFLYTQTELSPESARRYIERQLLEVLKQDKGSGCVIPQLNPFAKEIIELETKEQEIKCRGQDWVKCFKGECKVVPEILKSTKNIKCTYREIIYESDVEYFLGIETVVLGGDSYFLSDSDHVKIMCRGSPNSRLKKSNWKGYSAGVRTLEKKHYVAQDQDVQNNSWNVLLFGYDSASKNGFIRKMPRTYQYLSNIMQGTILDGYNVLGDETPSTLFPLLTGKTELELPDVRTDVENNNTLDDMPFIFYKLKEHGYRTAYLEDAPWYETFQYRYKGFRKQPTDHYLRPFLLEERKGNWWQRIKGEFCLGDTPQFKFMMNLTDQMLRLPGRKFIFTFISDITRDNFGLITNADNDMVDFLKSLTKLGVLKNTLVMIMGDHGLRYDNIRNTFQGKLEERLPFMCILLPEKLKRQRPKAQSFLKSNVNVLTTPHDIHATILDVLGMKQYMNPYKVPGADLPRGMSLLKRIPQRRSCSEAGIEPHWCACLVWHNVSATDAKYMKAANAFIDYVNTLTADVRQDCAFRNLVEVKWVMQQSANSDMLSLIASKTGGDYFGARVKHAIENYHIRVVLGPGRAIYEASMKYLVDDDRFVISSRDIARTNKYGREPNCISARYPHLNPYCYCMYIMTPHF